MIVNFIITCLLLGNVGISAFSYNYFDGRRMFQRNGLNTLPNYQRDKQSSKYYNFLPLYATNDKSADDTNSKSNKWNPLASLSKSVSSSDKALAEALVLGIKDIFENVTATVAASDDTSKSNVLTKEVLSAWDQDVKKIAVEIRSSTSKQIALTAYKQLLFICAQMSLNPLQLSTFDIISHAVIDNLLQLFPKNAPVTELVDDLTDIHLEFIEPFINLIGEGQDGYSQSSQQEFLCYQYASLARKVYQYLSQNLGDNFDSSSATQAMRLENWVAPVFARLQRRFVRFSSSNVEEKSDELAQRAFDDLLSSVSVDIYPRYKLQALEAVVKSKDIEGNSPKSENAAFSAWDQADSIIKLIRNTVIGYDLEMLSLESKLLRTTQNEISSRMRPLGKLLENIFYVWSDNVDDVQLKSKEFLAVEDMLNIGHSVIAAAYTLWHIKYNIIGTINSEGKYEKDYISSVTLTSKDSSKESIPKYLRLDVKTYIDGVKEFVNPSSYLEACAVQASAIRSTVSDYLRALIIFNSDQSDWPQSRDASYQAVLSAVIVDALLLPDDNFEETYFYQNLIAMAALEEAMGVREPRAACAEAFKLALKKTSFYFLRAEKLESAREKMLKRVRIIEDALSMILRLPEGKGKSIKFEAFKEIINGILTKRENIGGGLKEVDRVYRWIAEYLTIDESVAKNYIGPLAQAKFDKAIGSILLSADLVSSLPASMGQSYVEQIYTLADQVSISREAAITRVSLLSGAVFESVMEAALEESRRQNYDRVEILFRKAYNMYRHPLLTALDRIRMETKSKSLKTVGIQMVYGRLGKNLTVELIRLIDTIRSSMDGQTASNAQGWGSSSPLPQKADPGFIQFLEELQQEVMQEYTSASVGRGL